MDTISLKKKDVERITKPEQLNDCIKVIRPGVWISLVITLLLLIAACIWAAFGYMETVVKTAAWSDGETGEITLFLKKKDAEYLNERTNFRIGKRQYKIDSIDDASYRANEELLPENLLEMALHVSGIEHGEWIRKAYAKSDLPAGLYEAVVTVERIHPITFITN